MEHVEIIKCTHGVVFAACVDGYQDKEWNKSKREYLRGGCTVEMVERDEFGEGVRIGSCDCNKSKRQSIEPKIENQLSMF